MARTTGPAKKFAKNLSKSAWGNRSLFLFDAIMQGVLEEKGKRGGTAAEKLSELAKDLGLNPHSPVLHATVTAMKGPVEKDATVKARTYVKELLETYHA